MIQNIKVDVIYYKCPTDFEMEFNLCGCCRMRMLTDKTADRTGFIRALSRAVSRSRVIICSGPLFDTEGLIRSVAAAIGKPLETVDSAAYGIRGNARVEIIKGSMPLVSTDGMFGGCIIESGPQSIVILTESRSIRKSLMNDLIHPYIEELSRAVAERLRSSQTTEHITPPAAAVIPEPIVPEIKPDLKTEEILPDETPVPDEPPEETGTEPDDSYTAEAVEETDAGADSFSENPVSMEQKIPENEEVTEKENEQPEKISGNEEIQETEDTDEAGQIDINTFSGNIDNQENNDVSDTAERQEDSVEEDVIPDGQYEPELYVEPGKVKFSRKNYYENSYGDMDDNSGYITGDGEEHLPQRGSMRIAVTVVLLILLIAVIVLLYLLVFEPLRAGISPAEYINSLFGSSSSSSGLGV